MKLYLDPDQMSAFIAAGLDPSAMEFTQTLPVWQGPTDDHELLVFDAEHVSKIADWSPALADQLSSPAKS